VALQLFATILDHYNSLKEKSARMDAFMVFLTSLREDVVQGLAAFERQDHLQILGANLRQTEAWFKEVAARSEQMRARTNGKDGRWDSGGG